MNSIESTDVILFLFLQLHWEYGLMSETLFLVVNLMDIYLSSQIYIRRTNLQLVGIAAMLVACKYEEINVPYVQDFRNTYTENDVLQMV